MSSNITNNSVCVSSFDCYPTAFLISKIISWTELVLILTLNSLVITLILCKGKTSRMHFFVMHLAISDLMVGITYLLPVSLTFEIGLSLEIHSCRFANYIAHTSLYASSAMLVLLSIDRLYVVSCPISASKQGKWFKYSSIGTAWLLALILAMPLPIVSSVLAPNKGRLYCDTVYDDLVLRRIFLTLFTSCVLFVPAIMIIFCYITIVIILWRKARKRTQIPSVASHERRITRNLTVRINRNISMTPGVLPRAMKRSIEMTLLVVIAFILSWSPICFNTILHVYDVIDFEFGLYFTLNAMAPLNCAVNPVVFLVFTRCIKSTKKFKKNVSISLNSTRLSVTRSQNEDGVCQRIRHERKVQN